MNIIKYKNPRNKTYFYGRYVLSCWIICACVFGIYLHTMGLISGKSFLNIFLGVVAPVVVGWMVMLSFFTSASNDSSVMDKSLSENPSAKAVSKVFVNTSLGSKTYYYPAINRSVDPIFSIQAIFNVTIGSFLIPYTVAFWAVTHNFLMALAVSGIAATLAWVVFVALNMPVALRVLRGQAEARASNDMSDSFVNMNYSYSQLEHICNSQEIRFFVEADKKVDLLRLIARKSVVAGQVLNDLIMDGYADANLMRNEVAVIEHISNSFVPTTIITSNKFFKKYSGKKEAAEKIYIEKIAGQIREEALSLRTKIEAISATIKTLAEERESAIKKADEDSINIDVALIAMTESANLPIPQFPEFHSLKFNNDMNKAAAKNIVTGSLMTLVDAKNRADSIEDKNKLDAEIGNVKSFVKSLAIDTPESAAREVRVNDANKADALYLGTDISGMNGVDNIIAIQKRYIDSYDTTLPLSNKNH